MNFEPDSSEYNLISFIKENKNLVREIIYQSGKDYIDWDENSDKVEKFYKLVANTCR